MWVIHPETIVFSSKGNQQIYSEDTCINSLHYLNDVFLGGCHSEGRSLFLISFSTLLCFLDIFELIRTAPLPPPAPLPSYLR